MSTMLEGDETFLDLWVKQAAMKLADDHMASPHPVGDWLLSQVEGLALFCRRYPLVGAALEEAYDPRLNHMLRSGYGLLDGWQYRYVTEIQFDPNVAGAIVAVAEMLATDTRLENLVTVSWAKAAVRFSWNKLFVKESEHGK